MKKEFKSLDNQLALLKARGLTINNEQKAKRYLLTNNYYSIINGYGKYFQNKPDHYISGVSFDEVSSLYFFENEIKKAVFKAILQIEHHIKSIVAYRFAEMHPKQTYAYLSPASYNQQQKRLIDAYSVISKFSIILKRNITDKKSSIYHYIKNYHDVPIWVMMEYLDFGGLYYFMNVLPDSLLNKIAADFTPFFNESNPNHKISIEFTPEIMLKFMKNIHETRNVCAHNRRLLDFKCHADSPYFSPLHSKYGVSKDEYRTSFYTTFITM